MHFAVIGNPISHSLSPQIHPIFAKKVGLSINYTAILGNHLHFEQQVFNFFLGGGQGLNVTSPFKERAFAMADNTSERCTKARSANTLWMKNGFLQADNTDGIGFVRDISKYRHLTQKSILILGAGGAARGIIPAILAENPAQIWLHNRSPKKAEQLCLEFPQIQLACQENAFDIVINATSAETFHSLPPFVSQSFCYDLRYNQQKPTAFINFAQSLGYQCVDGLGMLIEQAAESFIIWHKVKRSSIMHDFCLP